PAPSVGDQHLASIASAVLNPEQIAGSRSLPMSLDADSTSLPLGVDLYKIGVAADGIYELTYQALQEAGMTVDEVDPATLEMMVRGQPVSTEFSGDSDNSFEPGESLRFYGHVFDGSRLEKQFITENIYWLWADGQARPINTVASIAGQPVTSYLASLTREPETIYFPGFTAYWPENEPDAWYWDWWGIFQDPLTRTYTVTLPNPAPVGAPAQFTAEFSSQDSHIADQAHSLAVTMNNYPSVAERSWWGERNFNVSASVPLTVVLHGANSFDIRAQTEGTSAHVALNRITVDYQRVLRAIDDQLIFSDQSHGTRQYQVQGFSQNDRAGLLAWDITDPNTPTAVLTSSLDISGSGPFTVTFGRQVATEAAYILTSVDNILTPTSLSPYVVPQLDPPHGAEWLAIAYKDFLTETQRLADHRSQASFGGLSTHVVDIEDVINQYGYGLPVPAAIHDYLAHALSAWSVKPSYVVLVGDTTLDPRHIKSEWTDEQYVLTDLPFVDPYNGQIPSDLTFALLSGDDLLPDLAVGRLAVESVAELTLVIDKIIRYDQNQRLSFGWMQNMLFVADKYDPAAADFCAQNMALANRLPPSLNSEFLCLDDYYNGGTPDAAALRTDMLAFLENTGATLLTYRGHGAINYWGGNPLILSLSYASELKNQQPFVVVSGDCLDGHYAYPPYEGLGERLVNFWTPSDGTADGTYGAAAHWGSSGLGIPLEHTVLLNGLYDGLFSAGLTALGDATTYAKLTYSLGVHNDPSLLYSFNLQGDPAMHLMRPSIELTGAWSQDIAFADRQVTLTLNVQNHGVYPSPVTLVGEPISDFSIAAITSTAVLSASMAGEGARITLQFGQRENEVGIPRNGQATVTVTYDISPDAVRGPRIAHFHSEAPGLEVWPGDEQIAEQISVLQESIWLPILRR
ncbi:MAG: C25 family cysteine peptidase, partial [Chloroflexota bacterium]